MEFYRNLDSSKTKMTSLNLPHQKDIAMCYFLTNTYVVLSENVASSRAIPDDGYVVEESQVY